MTGQTPKPPDETISHNLRCAGCGYELIGLPRSGVCPECGLAIASSLEQGLARIFGQRGAKRLTATTEWLEAGVGLHILGPCFPPVVLVGTLVWLVGAWRLARAWPTDTPAMRWHAGAARAAMRGAIGATTAAGIGGAGLGMAHWFWERSSAGSGRLNPERVVATVVGSVVLAAGLAWSVWSLLGLLAGLASHLPRTGAVRPLRRAQRWSVMWALGVAAFLFLWTSGVLDASFADAVVLIVPLAVVGWLGAAMVLNALSGWEIALKDAL